LVKLARRIKNTDDRGDALLSLGESIFRIGNIFQGKILIQESMKVSQGIIKNHSFSLTLPYIESKWNQGELELAIDLFHGIVEVSKGIQSLKLRCKLLINLGELVTKLNDINLWEGYQKLRASHLIIEFEKQYKQTNVHLNYGINNQKATMDFRPFLNLKSGYNVGIQIEGNQYRKFVEGQKASDFADNLLKYGVFLDSNKKFMKDVRYLNYGNSFKYQYDKITTVVSFADLFKRIDNDINYIIDNKNNIEDQIPSS
jgi:hypothetical protein